MLHLAVLKGRTEQDVFKPGDREGDRLRFSESCGWGKSTGQTTFV